MKHKLLRFSLFCMLMTLFGGLNAFADDVTIAKGTFDGKAGVYTEGWTTTATGAQRNDCVVVGKDENITSPALDLSQYSEITISIKARRYGTLSGSKATIDAAIGSSSLGTTDASGTSATTALTDIKFTPTAEMTAVKLVFTCTNATSAGSTHGAGINSIVITGTKASGGGETPTFRNIQADLTQLQALATGNEVFIKVSDTGEITEAASAEEANATLKGNWHGTSYGWSNFTASVPVQGCVKITYATHDYGNDIVVTNTAGAEVAKFNTQGAKWSSDHNNVVVAYYRTNEATTLNFSKANYNPYFAVEAIDPADIPAEVTKYNITFAAGEGTGVAPAALEIEAGSKFNAPKNYTLYAEGKTLTGWNDGTTTYAVGAEITPAADMTLTAEYTANEVSLADRTGAVTISYALDGYNDNPKYSFNGTTGIIVTQATVNSKTIDVKATVDASTGKFAHNGSGWHQVNAGTRVLVPSVKDAVIAVATYNDATSVRFNDIEATADGNTAKFTATDDFEVGISQMSNNYWNALTITLPAPQSGGGDDPDPSEPLPADRTATWDYSNADVMTETMALSAGTGTVKAIEDNGVLMTVISNGATFRNNGNNIQVRKGAEFRIPVQSTSDVVTIKGYPSYSYYSISGGEEITNTNENPQTEYKAKASDVEKGYVSVVSTNDNNYFYSLSVLQKSPYQEKAIYKTDFSEWTETAAGDAVVVNKQTKFTSEDFAFTLHQTSIMNTTDTKFSAYTELPRMTLRAEKNKGSYIITSPLAQISKVRYIHGATGSNRGWKLEAKGDGDADWVVISDAVANPNAWSEVSKEVNRTNCQLRFTNLADGQNAFLFELDIYGMVDMSKSPILGTFKANGVQYVAGDIFEMDNDGNYQATIELSKKETMISAENPLTEVVADNGELGDITYEAVGTGCKVTIPVTASGKTAKYIASFVQKPDFTLTYFNTDGSEMGTQIVEKDATIGTFSYDYTTATAGAGQKVRGWFEKVDGGRKFTTDDVIKADVNLYAVATEIEVANTTSRYAFILTDKNFYAEDHECFNPEGAGKWHDAQHGWIFGNGDKIMIPVGGNANLIFGLCQYSKENPITITDGNDAPVATIDNAKVSSDGASKMVSYVGGATTLTITFAGETYIHTLTVANIADKPVKKEGSWILVEPNDAASLLNAIDAANESNSTTDAARTFIFIPDGTYDFGKIVLTGISGHNISFIGQSMAGTIIKNAPAKENEGIGTTATLYNTGNDNYFQDLTIQNALDYYGAQAAGLAGGRAVCLWDKGTNTICKNVTMLSYQDTYYSNNNNMQAYWEDCDIHGTVDFICGGGDIRFQNTTLSLEARQSDGKGGRTITAPTTTTNFGYVFDNCTIVDLASEGLGNWNFGRTWQSQPICVYLNTTLDDLAKSTLVAKRWTEKGMNNTNPKVFGEYGTKDATGTNITPESNIITSYDGGHETILTAEQAAAYSYDKMFAGSWKPASLTLQVEAPNATYADGNVTWTPADDGAVAYALFKNGEFAGLTSGTSIAMSVDTEDKLTIRAANRCGGFGKAKDVEMTATGIKNTNAAIERGEQVIYNLQGVRVNNTSKGIYIVNGHKVVIK